jgi:1,4-dihydroxy-2-naphthoyl-CoA synthase
VFPDDEFEARVWSLAETFAQRSPSSLAFMKRMTASRAVDDRALSLEVEAAVHVLTAADAREGLAAFSEKRVPAF